MAARLPIRFVRGSITLPSAVNRDSSEEGTQ